VVDGPNGKVASRIEARIGLRLPGKVEVLEGLSAGDMVVTAGQARLGRGEAVPLRVVDLSRPAGAAARPAGAASGPRAPSP
jgi:membrane fusion protein (multidrug efflux system)